ncbi:MAG: hypothetical protein LBB41_02495 [Prevotellaceae bacterium]|jgi:mannitol-specific phosphotransferase system IIBC component|nr:hypothetical protein [Prevotellaceae bacterium]
MKNYFEKEMEKKIEKRVKGGFHKFFHGLFHVIFGVAAFAAFTAIVMLLWNWLLPAIFGVAAINFWQALGVLVLSKILFGNFSFGKHWAHPHGHHNVMRDKWLKMSDDERKMFIKNRHRFFDDCRHSCEQKNENVNE